MPPKFSPRLYLKLWLILPALVGMSFCLAEQAKAQDTFKVKVTVIVTDETGNAIKGAKISIPRQNPSNPPTTGITGDDGRWSQEVAFIYGNDYKI